jgi:ABC-type uncharacterized transport system substrate-binding protein
MTRILSVIMLLVVALAAPLAAEAQQAGKVYRIGLLSSRPYPPMLESFVAEMGRTGWIEGRDYVLDPSYTEGEQSRAATLAKELVNRRVDLILTSNTANALAARQASDTIPIVMLASGYPVESGLASSLARPGGNVTGNSIYAGTELFGKYVSLLREVSPGMRRLGVLWDYAPPAFSARETEIALDELQRAARALGVGVTVQMIRGRTDLNPALAALAHERIDGLFVTSGPVHSGISKDLLEFAATHQLPSITDHSLSLVRTGGALMTYSTNLAALGGRAAYFVNRILRGTKPADLPIERPTTFELVINLKTAKALGLTIPPSVLARADEVIQ